MEIESFAGKCRKLCSRIQPRTRRSFVHLFLPPVWLVALRDIITLQRCASLKRLHLNNFFPDFSFQNENLCFPVTTAAVSVLFRFSVSIIDVKVFIFHFLLL